MEDLRKLLEAGYTFTDEFGYENIVVSTGGKFNKYVFKKWYDDFYLEAINDIESHYNNDLKSSSNTKGFDIVEIKDREGVVIWQRK